MRTPKCIDIIGSNTLLSWLTVSDLEGPMVIGPVVVGRLDGAAMIWDQVNGARNLQQVLEERYDLVDALDGWELTEARDISADGRTIVGSGQNPSGE